MDVLQIAFYLAVPVILLLLRKPLPLIENIGVVTLSYIAGIILGNIPGIAVNETLATEVMGPAVVLAIPLLLFNTDIGALRAAGLSMLKSFTACIVAVAILTVAMTFAFRDRLENTWQFGAMVFGVYTGGTVNLSSIGLAIDAPEEAIVMINAADLLWGGLILLFLLTIAKRVYAYLLGNSLTPHVEAQDAGDRAELSDEIQLRGGAIALFMATLAAALSAGLSYAILGRISEVVMYLGVTAIGIGLAAYKPVRTLKGSFGLGNYLLYVFCAAIGSLANVREMISNGPDIILYVGSVIMGSMVSHILLSRLMKLDTDAVIIASTAGIYGPPFVGPIARAIGNTRLIPLGIALALIGFAVGNYGGIALSQLLKVWLK